MQLVTLNPQISSTKQVSTRQFCNTRLSPHFTNKLKSLKPSTNHKTSLKTKSDFATKKKVLNCSIIPFSDRNCVALRIKTQPDM